MKYNIITKKVNLSESSKEQMTKKLDKFDKFFRDMPEARVMVREQRDELIVEVTISVDGMMLRAEVKNKDLLVAVDRIVAALERQIRKNKTKLAKRLRTGAGEGLTSVSETAPEEDEKEEFKIIRNKRIAAKPMHAEEAILQMNLLGHDFFVFTNPDTNETNLVYKRKDRDYGLIELE